MINQDAWHNCYDDSWKGHIVPESFAHPAKMAYSLTQRIFKHALSEGWIKAGDTVVDPFGGIGSTGIVGAHFGLQVVCVELEKKFVDLARQNFELHRKTIDTFAHFGKPLHPVMIQGDSRQLSEIIGQAECLISSPPYHESLDRSTVNPAERRHLARSKGISNAEHISPIDMERISKRSQEDYGSTPGQLGAMKPGSIDAILSSPPFQQSLTDKPSKSVRKMHGANMGRSALGDGYGHSPGNIANLPSGDVAAIISSPPYEEGIGHKSRKPTKAAIEKRIHNWGCQYNKDNPDNVGSMTGDTFWQAAKLIVEQCFQILRPGGHAIWVVKDFVKSKKRVDFTGDWQRLCESVGFKTLHKHHAMLVKEDVKDSLFGDKIVKRKERKSFFRRLAEAKGSPRIDYEVILCMTK